MNESHVNPCTLGFLVDSKKEIESRWGIKANKKIMDPSISEIMKRMILGLNNRFEILKKYYDINSVQIFDEKISATKFDLSAEEKKWEENKNNCFSC